MSNLPIGVFDSGLGGLTAVKELSRLMPFENIVYFGDTGRVPYGTRSRETIRKYASEDLGFLLSHNVKMLVAACGTVSSVASDIGEQLAVPYTGVVFPAAKAAVAATRSKRIGVIGTSATIKSHAYGESIGALMPDACVFERDCPLFVPFVENGFIDEKDELVRLIVERYLAELKAENIDTLILGCTHYPIIAKAIKAYMGEGVELIDSGAAVAGKVRDILSQQGLLKNDGKKGQMHFYVSDRTEGFTKIARVFLGGAFSGEVEHIDIEAVRGVDY